LLLGIDFLFNMKPETRIPFFELAKPSRNGRVTKHALATARMSSENVIVVAGKSINHADAQVTGLFRDTNATQDLQLQTDTRKVRRLSEFRGRLMITRSCRPPPD
jgi:hypothetical protein